MKKYIIAAACVVAAVAFTANASAKDRIAFGSTAIKSVHYTYAVSAAKAINKVSGDKVDVTVIATGGAVDNLSRIARKQIQMGLGTYATIYQAYKGIGKFKGKAQPNLRSLWVHAPAIQAWVVRADSGIKKLTDLNGKTFTSGQRGSATEQLAKQMLEALGIKPNYYQATLSDAVAAVKDGRNNGYVKAGSSNSLDGTTLELRAFTPIRLLGFSQDQVKTVQAKFPFITFKSLKAGQIEGVPAITLPVQVIGQFTTKDALTDAEVEAILTGIVDGKKIQDAAFPGFKNLDVIKDSLAVLNVPLHKGAVKFYRSRGAEVPARLIPPEMK